MRAGPKMWAGARPPSENVPLELVPYCWCKQPVTPPQAHGLGPHPTTVWPVEKCAVRFGEKNCVLEKKVVIFGEKSSIYVKTRLQECKTAETAPVWPLRNILHFGEKSLRLWENYVIENRYPVYHINLSQSGRTPLKSFVSWSFPKVMKTGLFPVFPLVNEIFL